MANFNLQQPLATPRLVHPAALDRARSGAARAAVDEMRRRTSGWLLTPPGIPLQPGGWMHEYVCPDHWQALIFDPDSPGRHRCPQGEVLTGTPYDAAWRVYRHRQISTGARDLALVFAADQDAAFATAAKDILTGYADRYRHYAGNRSAQSWMLAGRVFHQALTEALWAVPLIQAYDHVRGALSAADAEHIINDLLRPIGETLRSAHHELVDVQEKVASNYTAWLNAALGCLGFALGDDDLTATAIDGPGGFRAHLGAAVLPDGFEHEGSTYYHAFVALAYSILAETALAEGRDLYAERGPDGQSIEAMWQALAALATPDGTLPHMNDGPFWDRGPFDAEICELYEIALARTANLDYAWLLNRTYSRRGQPRDQWSALLRAERDLPEVRPPDVPSICLPHIGITVLRDPGSADHQAAYLPFGPYGGDHGHFDRLAVQIWPWSIDPGTPPYSLEARRGWYQQTAAHNAVLVDGAGQAPCAATLRDWRASPNGGTAWLEARDAYPGVRYGRRISLAGDTLTDLTTLESETPHVYDWLIHIDAEPVIHGLSLSPPEEGMAPREGPYRSLDISATAAVDGAFRVGFAHSARSYQLTIEPGFPAQVMLATGPGIAAQPHARRHVLIVRMRGREARVVATCEGAAHG